MKSLVKVGVFATLCLIVLGVLIWKIEDLNPFGKKGQRLRRRLQLGRRARRQGLGAHRRRAGRPRRRPRPRRQPGPGHHAAGEADPAHRRHHGEDRQPRPAGREVRRAVPGPPDAPPLPDDAVLVGTTPPSLDDAMAKINDIGASIQKVTGQLAGQRRRRRHQPPAGRHPAHQRRDPRRWWRRTAPTSPRACATSTQLTATLARELPRLAAADPARPRPDLDPGRRRTGATSRPAWANIRELTAKLQTSADNLNKISGKIASGKGTIGKLVNDEKAYNERRLHPRQHQGRRRHAERELRRRSTSSRSTSTCRATTCRDTAGLADHLPAGHRPAGRQAPLPRRHLSSPGRQALGEDPDRHRHPPGRQPPETTTIQHDHPRSRPTRHRPLRLQGAAGRAALRRPHREHGRRADRVPAADPRPPAPALLRGLRLQPSERPARRTCACSAAASSTPTSTWWAATTTPLENAARFFLGGGIRWNDDNIKSLLGLAGWGCGRVQGTAVAAGHDDSEAFQVSEVFLDRVVDPAVVDLQVEMDEDVAESHPPLQPFGEIPIDHSLLLGGSRRRSGSS